MSAWPAWSPIPQEGWKDSDPAHSYWFRERHILLKDLAVATNNPEHAVLSETQGRFLLVGDPRTKDCSLEIRDAPEEGYRDIHL